MAELTPREIRDRFLKFFEKRGHKILPSASLVPENDPSVLFNTAGMQSLVPYLLGQKHPEGTRLANIQKCVRTVDIDEIGDNTHLTFFEMMGNWSLGDYGKKDAITWSYELLTNKEEGFGLDPQGMYVTCFEGDENAPRDEESAQIWREIFEKNNVTGERIYFLSANKNWWSAGDNGPCGPDTEMFYDLTGTLRAGMTRDEYLQADDEQKIVEVWNDVFMEYLKKDGKVVGKLENKNVDTGSGFERMVAVIEGESNIYETSLFKDILSQVDKLRRSNHESTYSGVDNPDKNIGVWVKRNRIIVDHLRTSAFLISEGILPSNKDRGYVLRRLMRRTMNEVGIKEIALIVFNFIENQYADIYPNVNAENINKIYQAELNTFKINAEKGFREIEKKYKTTYEYDSGPGEKDIGYEQEIVSGQEVFYYFSTFGITKESFFDSVPWCIPSKSFDVEYEQEFKKHQQLSRSGAEQKFKGGLAGTGEMETKYHTATHLLHQALRDVLGDMVEQRGSNITSERLRFDFSFDRKMTDDEKTRVEQVVNEKIQLKLPMNKVTLPKAEAEKIGALHFFGDKYGDTVDVYYLGDSLETAYSKEFCGGPHVGNTGDLACVVDPEGNPRDNAKFKIIKEEAVAAGIRRIKAILE